MKIKMYCFALVVDFQASSSKEDGYPKRLPCKDNNNRISYHGETYYMSKCSRCTCDNSTLGCQFESCQPPTCANPLEFENVCCPACPYSKLINTIKKLCLNGGGYG